MMQPIDYSSLEQQHNLPVGLLAAVASAESAGNPNAVSPKGAQGLFQFMPPTAAQYGVNPNDPQSSAQGAARMFGDLSTKYGGDVPSMLAAYNWGQGNVDRHGLKNAPPETQAYIQRVSSNLPQQGQITTSTQNLTMPMESNAAMVTPNFDLGDTLYGQKPQAPAQGFDLGDTLYGGSSQPDKQVMDTPSQIGSLHAGMQSNAYGAIASDDPATRLGANMVGFGARAIKAVPGLSEAGSGIAAGLGFGQGANFGDRYNNLQQSQQAMRESYTQAEPTTQVGPVTVGPGGLGQGGLGLALTGVMPGPKAPPVNFASAVGQGIKTGAQYGATYGAADTNSFLPDNMALEQRSGNAIKGAGLGATMGAGFGGLGYSIAKPLSEKAPLAADFKDASRTSYQAADSAGVSFNPQAVQDLGSAIDKELPTTGKMNAALHSDTLSALGDFKDQINSGAMTLEDLHQNRQLFQQVAQDNAGKADGLKANQVVSVIDDFINKAGEKPKMVNAGTPEQLAAWKDAQTKWAQGSRIDEIQRIMDKASYGEQPARSIQTGFKNLMFSKRFRYYSPEQQELIKQAATASPTVEGMKVLGSRLISVLSMGSLHPIQALGEAALSSGARDLGSMLQANKGQAIINNIADKNSVPSGYQMLRAPLQFPRLMGGTQ